MAEAAIVETRKNYLAVLPARGIHARRAILYGSHARNSADSGSDIDLIVIAPEFDAPKSRKLVTQLWLATPEVHAPIEPVACGEVAWETDDWQPLLEITRREGNEIRL